MFYLNFFVTIISWKRLALKYDRRCRKPRASSFRTIILSYDSLLESHCERNFYFLQIFQSIKLWEIQNSFCDWLKCLQKIEIFITLAFQQTIVQLCASYKFSTYKYVVLSLVLLLISNLTNELRLHQFLQTCSPPHFWSLETDANGAH